MSQHEILFASAHLQHDRAELRGVERALRRQPRARLKAALDVKRPHHIDENGAETQRGNQRHGEQLVANLETTEHEKAPEI